MASRRGRPRQSADQPNVARHDVPDVSHFDAPNDADTSMFGARRKSGSELERDIEILKQQLASVPQDGELKVGDFILTSMGLQFLGDTLSFSDWQYMGSYLQMHQDAIQWMIGDWVVLGEAYLIEWSDGAIEMDVPDGKYRWIASQTDYSYSRLRNFAWVARQFPVSRRRDTLTFSHHMEVANLNESEQEYFLGMAEPTESRKRLSVRALRSLIEEQYAIESGGDAPTHDRTPNMQRDATRALRMLTRNYEQLGSIKDVKKLDEATAMCDMIRTYESMVRHQVDLRRMELLSEQAEAED